MKSRRISASSGHDRLMGLCRIGYWASSLCVLIAGTAILFLLYMAATQNQSLNTELIEGLNIEAYVEAMTLPQLWVATLFWLAVDVLGLIMLLQVRALFAHLMREGIFAQSIARHLRRIGLIILSMAPVSILSETFGGMVISAWHTGASMHGSVAIEDTDIYAIVIGLVITAVSHIMVEAAKLSEENQAFV